MKNLCVQMFSFTSIHCCENRMDRRFTDQNLCFSLQPFVDAGKHYAKCM